MIISRSESKYEESKDELNESCEFYSVDVKDSLQVENIAQKLQNIQIDILINNAGIWTANKLEKENIELRKDALDVNLLGQINITESFLPNIIRSKSPQIIFVSSVGATQGFGGEGSDWSTFNASKWGLRGYFLALKDRFRGEKIKISSIYPGGFASQSHNDEDLDNWHNQPWMMKTESVVEAVNFMINQPDNVNIDELIITNQ